MELVLTVNCVLLVWIVLCIAEIRSLKAGIKLRSKLLSACAHPRVHLFRSFTPQELLSFTKDPILISVCGQVFDVSNSQQFYGQNGPYRTFAGKEIAGMLARNDVDDTLPFDISLASADEIEALESWETRFRQKYLHVGYLHS